MVSCDQLRIEKILECFACTEGNSFFMKLWFHLYVCKMNTVRKVDVTLSLCSRETFLSPFPVREAVASGQFRKA